MFMERANQFRLTDQLGPRTCHPRDRAPFAAAVATTVVLLSAAACLLSPDYTFTHPCVCFFPLPLLLPLLLPLSFTFNTPPSLPLGIIFPFLPTPSIGGGRFFGAAAALRFSFAFSARFPQTYAQSFSGPIAAGQRFCFPFRLARSPRKVRVSIAGAAEERDPSSSCLFLPSRFCSISKALFGSVPPGVGCE